FHSASNQLEYAKHRKWDLWGIVMPSGFDWRVAVFVLVWLAGSNSILNAAKQPAIYSVGAAPIDITPHLSSDQLANRKIHAQGTVRPIWAKALAISSDAKSEPVILMTVDNFGIPAPMCDAVAKRLADRIGLKRAQLSITSSHSHTGVTVRGAASTLFGKPISD